MPNQIQKLPTSEQAAALETGSYVEWSAIIGGIVLASAISIVMLAFGSAIGLSFSSASVTAKGYAIGAGIGAAIWFLWVQVSSFMAGSYLAGRLRKRKHDATEHEVEVRDGSHGLLVWAGSVLIGSYLALSGVSSLVNSIGSIAKTATESVATATNGAASGSMQYYTDVMLREPSPTGSTPAHTDRAAVAGEINTILARSTLAAPTPDDKAYLAQLVSQQSGVTADVARKRVDDDTKSSELRIRCTMQVCTMACGNTAVMASGKPLRPSTTATRMSAMPRFLSSFMTLSQNLAPSVCSIQIPRISFVPSDKMPRAI